MANEKKGGKAAESKPAAPKRKHRSIDERIAELEAKRDAQRNRRVRTVTKHYAEAKAQRDAVAERLKNVEARLAEYAAELEQLGALPAETAEAQDKPTS